MEALCAIGLRVTNPSVTLTLAGLPASLPEAKKVSSASALLRSTRLGVQARYQQPKESDANKKAWLRKEQEEAKAEQAAAVEPAVGPLLRHVDPPG